MRVARSDPGGAAYLELQRLARSTRRPVQELLQLFILEAFVDRLARSDLTESLTLKGGVLLAAHGQRRPTRDIDLHASAIDNDTDVVREHIVNIAGIDVGDGVTFRTATATVATIRNDDTYPGVRISMRADLATARLAFHVDVSVGDPVMPPAVNVELPRLLGGTLIVRGYRIETIHAEKIVTAIVRGTVNTRWRDFLDVVSLASRHQLDGDVLVEAIRRVAHHRHAELEPLASVLDGFAELAQAQWSIWRRKQQLEDRAPERFTDLVDQFTTFADPVVSGEAAGMRWDPANWRWR